MAAVAADEYAAGDDATCDACGKMDLAALVAAAVALPVTALNLEPVQWLRHY